MENHSDPIDPFADAPSSPPMSTNPPAVPSVASAAPTGPRRGRMAIATVATFGLVGTGVVGLSQLSSSDGDGEGDGGETAALAAAVTEEPADDTSDDTSEDMSDDTDDASTDDPADGEGDGSPSVDGEIVIDTGDGDPIVIDLGALDAATFEEFRECAGLPSLGDLELPDIDLEGLDLDGLDLEGLDLDGLDLEGLDLEGLDLDSLFGELDGPLSEWLDGLGDIDFPRYDGEFVFGPDGRSITVVDEDGVRVIDLGEGDASVTITQNDGEIDITTDGDVTVSELSDLFGDLPFDLDGLDLDGLDLDGLDLEGLDLDGLPDLAPNIDRLLDDLDGLDGLDLGDFPELPSLDLPAFDFPDDATIRNCLELVG